MMIETITPKNRKEEIQCTRRGKRWHRTDRDIGGNWGSDALQFAFQLFAKISSIE